MFPKKVIDYINKRKSKKKLKDDLQKVSYSRTQSINKRCYTCIHLQLSESDFLYCDTMNNVYAKRICNTYKTGEDLPLKNKKQCPSCGKVYERTNFYKSNRYSDGLLPYCKYCYKLRSFAYQDKRINSL